MICNACGQPSEPTAKFCSQCGAPKPVVNIPAPFVPDHAPAVRPANEKRKAMFLIVGFCAILGIMALVALYRSTNKTERIRADQEVIAKQDAAKLQAEEAEKAFKKMTPREHLEAAKRDFTAGASESQQQDGDKNVDALKASFLEKQGEALRTRYYAQKEREEKAEAAKQAREAAVVQEQAERQAESDLENARIQYAQKLQNNLLDNDMDADVNAVGSRHTTLRLKYVLATKLFVYKFSKEVLPEYIDDMRQLGFKKLIISNGYDEQWTWNL